MLPRTATKTSDQKPDDEELKKRGAKSAMLRPQRVGDPSAARQAIRQNMISTKHSPTLVQHENFNRPEGRKLLPAHQGQAEGRSHDVAAQPTAGSLGEDSTPPPEPDCAGSDAARTKPVRGLQAGSGVTRHCRACPFSRSRKGRKKRRSPLIWSRRPCDQAIHRTGIDAANQAITARPRPVPRKRTRKESPGDLHLDIPPPPNHSCGQARSSDPDGVQLLKVLAQRRAASSPVNAASGRLELQHLS